MNPLAVARGSTGTPDGVLVQEAAAGGGASYAALYDRYSEQVYNYCLRLTGSPHDAADATQDAFVGVLARLQHDDRPVLDFSSYLFAAARNESYALMRKRNRTEPTDDVPDRAASQPDLETDPERALLLRDAQETVRKANAELPPRYREVLALREVADRSYGEIGEIMGISENAAAQLIFRARGRLKQELAAGAVASVVVATDDCENARLLINRLEDGEPVSDEEQEWLDDHLEHCGKCRAARGVLLDVGASYRAWAVVPVIAALRPEILTSAGAAIGLDWSGVAASTPVVGGGGGSATGGAGAGGAGNGGAGSAASTGNGAAAGATGAGSAGASGGRSLLRPRGHHAAAQGALGAAVLAVTGIVVAGVLHDGSPVTREAAPVKQVRPAEKPNEAPTASAAKAKSAASASQPAVIHGFQSVAAAPGPAKQDLSTPPAAEPEQQGIGSPLDKRGRPPNSGGPKTHSPGPGGGGPGSGPGGGGPGQGPGTEPGGRPAPGGGPANPPGGTPGGQTDPPGQPTDPGTKPPPSENPPPTTGGDCTWRGHGGGPGGCPPGHGGVPPGHGGTPPGQSKKQP